MYRTHGYTPLRHKGIAEYDSWCGMKQRCYNPRARSFSTIGARDITVCDRWLNSFDNFLADMGRKPQRMHMHRIDPSLAYCPENCCWDTKRRSTPKHGCAKRSEYFIWAGIKQRRDQWLGCLRPDHRADSQCLYRRHRMLVYRYRLQRRELLRAPRLLHRRGRTLRQAQTDAAGGHRRSGMEQSLQHGKPPVRQAGIRQDCREGHQPIRGRGAEGVRNMKNVGCTLRIRMLLWRLPTPESRCQSK